MTGINRNPVKIDKESAPECISRTKDWLNWNGDWDTLSDSKDDCAAVAESDIEQENAT
jgi:hypothetical protein